MFEKLQALEDKFNEINERLMQPEVVNDGRLYTELMKEYKTLEPIAQSFGEYKKEKESFDEAKELLDDARARVAKVLGCTPGEIYFTSCGTESDNWAIKGAAMRMKKKGRTHIVTSKIEHHAVLHTCEALEKEGFTVTYVGVDEDGVVKLDELRAAVTEKTAVVAIMFSNNEVGTIQPIAEAAEIAHAKGALMFTDAVQAVGAVDIDLEKLPVDMLSASGHKLHAPKGVGMLFVRKGVLINNLIDGGGQEKRKRAGTENLPYIVGFARAVEAVGATSILRPPHVRSRDLPKTAPRVRNARSFWN